MFVREIFVLKHPIVFHLNIFVLKFAVYVLSGADFSSQFWEFVLKNAPISVTTCPGFHTRAKANTNYLTTNYVS